MLLPIPSTWYIPHSCGDTKLPYRNYQKSSLIQVSGSCTFQLHQERSSQFRTQKSALSEVVLLMPCAHRYKNAGIQTNDIDIFSNFSLLREWFRLPANSGRPQYTQN